MATYKDYKTYLASKPFRVMRSIAMKRTEMRCKRCGGTATQVHHHNGYPPWNSWDLPSALEPICQTCHAKEHGKDE